MVDFDELEKAVCQQLNRELANSENMKNPLFAQFATALNALAAKAAVTTVREYEKMRSR